MTDSLLIGEQPRPDSTRRRRGSTLGLGTGGERWEQALLAMEGGRTGIPRAEATEVFGAVAPQARTKRSNCRGNCSEAGAERLGGDKVWI
jgi:hypothetical protein